MERIWWKAPQDMVPPIESALSLEPDAEGRVAAGQGALLRIEERAIPVVIAWEPETGHHFVQALLRNPRDFLNSADALEAAAEQRHAGDKRQTPRRQSVSQHLDKQVSRRGLFDLFRNRSEP
ncbi:hypothetical protein MAIT1_01912 [Magnetofaba australis IT-1]|uniref:Uncharacterized protein n=1 Tax=Magnetofaba australis IT-1 TaxID=1434232 RepID=A0A1Y2K1E8_9PROT|nr:hypothetical protein MAIT1_01912 [Magnetofaba australis IT-1]